MNLILLVGGVVAAGLFGTFVFVFLRLFRSEHSTQGEPLWLPAISPARYRPMERLLGAEDIVFLAAQPGFTRAMGRRFRAGRRKIFRAYLRNLARDFGRLHRAARLLMLCAPQDRPDFAAALVRQRFLFERTVLLVQWRLLVNWASGAAVDVSGLVSALETMNAQVRALATMPAAA